MRMETGFEYLLEFRTEQDFSQVGCGGQASVIVPGYTGTP